jgi:hypothetical protein
MGIELRCKSENYLSHVVDDDQITTPMTIKCMAASFNTETTQLRNTLTFDMASEEIEIHVKVPILHDIRLIGRGRNCPASTGGQLFLPPRWIEDWPSKIENIGRQEMSNLLHPSLFGDGAVGSITSSYSKRY